MTINIRDIFPAPTEQTCQCCGNVYTGSRTRLCEDMVCRKWFADECSRNAYKYGSVSYPTPGIFYFDYAVDYDGSLDLLDMSEAEGTAAFGEANYWKWLSEAHSPRRQEGRIRVACIHRRRRRNQ